MAPPLVLKLVRSNHPPPASPAKSIHSIHSYHSPPGLCESSSSPAASIYYDMDSASQHNGDGVHMSLNVNSLANISEHDDEMFLEAFAAAASHHSGDMSALEREPDLLMGKFEDAFAAHDADDLFRNGEDVFFGSP